MKTDRLLATALAVGALASLGSVARAAPAPPPTGDAAAIELAQKVNAYYAAEPRMGVAFRQTVAGVGVNTRMLLVRGKVRTVIATAGRGRNQATTAVTPAGAYLRAPGARCWTKLGPASMNQTMINMPGSRFLAPQSIGVLTRLEVVERLPGGERMRLAYKVDPATGRIATMISDGVAVNLRTLPRAPEIPSTRPVCRA